jgi:hypothetical protein
MHTGWTTMNVNKHSIGLTRLCCRGLPHDNVTGIDDIRSVGRVRHVNKTVVHLPLKSGLDVAYDERWLGHGYLHVKGIRLLMHECSDGL